VTWHLTELLRSNSIEIAEVRTVGNHEVKVYRAISSAFFGEEDMDTWTTAQRQAFYSLIIQNSGAEAMAALWSGKISDERRSWLTWAWFHFDDDGWDEAANLMAETWDRLSQIGADSAARLIDGDRPSKTFICNLQAYPRSREARR
jgi:hypothetical protein